MDNLEHNKDNTFVILGNGPSLKDVDMSWIKENSDKFTVVGINRSYLVYPDHDFMFIQDVEPVLELFDAGKTDEEIRAMSITTTDYFDKRTSIMTRRRSCTRKEIERLRHLRKEGILKTGGARLYRTLGPWSVDQAISRLGHEFKRQPGNKDKPLYIFLVGFDLRHTPKQNHFYGAEVKKKCRWPHEGSNPRQIRRQLRYWQRVRRIFNRHKIRVNVIGKNSQLIKFYPSYEKIEQIFSKIPNPVGESSSKQVALTPATAPANRKPGPRNYSKKILNIRAQRRMREREKRRREGQSEEK